MANDISSLTIQGTTYPIKDATARTNAQKAITTANEAKSTATQAKTTADSALQKVNSLELQASLDGEVLTLSIGGAS